MSTNLIFLTFINWQAYIYLGLKTFLEKTLIFNVKLLYELKNEVNKYLTGKKLNQFLRYRKRIKRLANCQLKKNETKRQTYD